MGIEISLSAIAGSLLSLGLEYIPGIAPRYAALDEVQKRLVMLVLIIASAAGLFGASCGDFLVYVECSSDGILELLGMIGIAIAANQGTHGLTKKRSK